MSNLYGKANSTISEHIKKVYFDKELKEAETSQDDRIFGNSGNTTKNSFKKPKKYYNLQVIISVWFKVNSPQAISFRIWANSIIKEIYVPWKIVNIYVLLKSLYLLYKLYHE